MRRFLRTIRQFLSELRRRNVYQVALAYLAAGFVVVELANIAAGAFDLPGWFQPMVWTVCGLGFPIALVLAWALEMTPEGVRVEEADGGGEPVSSPGGVSLTSTGLIVGLLAVAIGLQLYSGVFSSAESSREASPAAPDTAQIDERSIAVLPFEALGKDEPGVFTDGMHDDLLTRLSNISALKVISRTAVQQYRDTELTTGEIADSLGVRWVLEGGVQEMGDRIQVNAQLIDPRSETHVWAEDYQRDLTAEDLFAIQGEITGEIAEALKAELTAGEQRRIAGAPTQNLQAYRLYVKGRSQLDTRTEKGMVRAASYFKQALREDSTYALAWSGLADVAGLTEEHAPDSMEAPEPGLKAAARRALQLDPDLAEAHASMGFYYFNQQNAPAALRHLKRSVELKPSYAQAYHWLGFLQLQIGREEAALRNLRRAVELNPQHYSANGVLIRGYLATGRAEAALTQTQTFRRMSSTRFTTFFEIQALCQLGRLDEAIRRAEEQVAETDTTAQETPNSRAFWQNQLALTEAAAGDPSRAERLLASGRGMDSSFGRGLLHAAVGNPDAAFEAFHKAVQGNQIFPYEPFLYFYPDLLGPLREDPRYEELIREINQDWGLNPNGSVPENADVPTISTDR